MSNAERCEKLQVVADIAKEAMALIDQQISLMKQMGMPVGKRPEWEGRMRTALAELPAETAMPTET